MSMHSSPAASAASSSVIYPIQLQDNDWPTLLETNLEAQTLLSNAIAHHEQYRDSSATVPSIAPAATTTKPIVSHLHHKNDVNPTHKAPYDDTLHYSEGENSGDEDKGSDSKPAPKKAGRKPLTTEPTNKRKAQNRAAQRAFRERKERYVKSLEDRIKELEETHASKSTKQLEEENMNLKVLVQKLETENYFLKEQSFTFDFPISQPGLYNLPATRTDSNNSAHTEPQSSSTSTSTLQQQHSPAVTVPDNTSSRASSAELSTPSPLSQPLEYKATSNAVKSAPNTAVAKIAGSEQHLPWTPPSSGGDSVPNSPQNHDLPTPEHEIISHITFSDSAGVVPRFAGSTALHDSVISSLLDASQQHRAQQQQPQITKTPQHQLQNLQQQPTPTPSTFLNHTSSPATFIPSTTTTTTIANTQSIPSRSNSNVYDHLSPLSTVAVHSDNGASPTLEELANTPLFETDKDGNVRFTPPVAPMSMSTTTFEQTQALFTDFRDPTDNREFFADFDETVPFQDDPIEGLLFNDQLLNYTNAFANVAATPAREESQAFFEQLKPSHVNVTPTPALQTATSQQQMVNKEMSPAAAAVSTAMEGGCIGEKGGLPILEPNEEAIPCPQAWEQIAKHPKFDDVEIDELCAELKSKAKCSGHGPVISVKDVDNLISRLDRGD